MWIKNIWELLKFYIIIHFDYLVAEEAKKFCILESLAILYYTENPLASN